MADRQEKIRVILDTQKALSKVEALKSAVFAIADQGGRAIGEKIGAGFGDPAGKFGGFVGRGVGGFVGGQAARLGNQASGALDDRLNQVVDALVQSNETLNTAIASIDKVASLGQAQQTVGGIAGQAARFGIDIPSADLQQLAGIELAAADRERVGRARGLAAVNSAFFANPENQAITAGVVAAGITVAGARAVIPGL